ncbi:MAG: hypothetical protein QW175_05915 [Candidatus Bathyarchaeia archaeon]
MVAEFVEIKQPVEYDKKRGRIVRYYRKDGRYFDSVDADLLRLILGSLKLKKDVELIENPNELIFWQYPKKPLIVLDIQNGKFLTTSGTIQHYGWKAVRHQASIVLRILKAFGLSKSKRKAIRYGKSREKAEAYKKHLKNEKWLWKVVLGYG